MVKANAIVDVINPPRHGGVGMFKVEVWGKEPHDFVRIYQIQATSDTMAAQEGIRRFVAEMEEKFQA